MSDYLVVLGVAVGLLVGYGIGRVMTTAAYLDRLQCDGVRLCAAHTPHLCRREGPCCSRCPCS